MPSDRRGALGERALPAELRSEITIGHAVRAFIRPVLAAVVLALGATLRAEDEVYQSPDTFLAETFGDSIPSPKVLWITKPMREEIKEILGHDLAGMRVRYWARDGRTTWILDEIGKVKPITTGIVVNGGRIERLKVLIYRESHGWEVKHPFFTDRFDGAARKPGGGLSQQVDNIAGATLSVAALKRLAELALYFHGQSDNAVAPP